MRPLRKIAQTSHGVHVDAGAVRDGQGSEVLEGLEHVGLHQRDVLVGDVAREREFDLDIVSQTSALGEHQNSVGQLDGLANVVRDEDDRFTRLGPDRVQLSAQRPRRNGIEVAERLVHEQHVGLGRERPCDADALLHAARQLAGVLPALVAQLHHLQVVPTAFAGGLVALPLDEQHVVHHGPPRQQPRGLENITRMGRLAVLRDAHPAAGRYIDAGQDVQQRRLSAARWPDDGDERVAADAEVHVLQRHHLVGAKTELLVQVVDRDVSHARCLPQPLGGSSRLRWTGFALWSPS